MGNSNSNSSNKKARDDFENLARDINDKLIRPSEKFFKSEEFKQGLGKGVGGVGSVLGQISNGAGKVLDNPILTGGVSLLAPELLPALLAMKAGTKIGSQVGNELEKGGNKINGQDNSASFH